MPNSERFRCPECRTRRTSGAAMVLHMMQCKRQMCDCGGYHFRHRLGSGMCYENPASHVKHASRAGTPDDELLDVAASVAWHLPGKPSKVCPF